VPTPTKFPERPNIPLRVCLSEIKKNLNSGDEGNIATSYSGTMDKQEEHCAI
jgi:hypothetical protein